MTSLRPSAASAAFFLLLLPAVWALAETDGYGTYRDLRTGLAFHYPAGWQIDSNRDALVITTGKKTEAILLTGDELRRVTAPNDPRLVRQLDREILEQAPSLKLREPVTVERLGDHNTAILLWTGAGHQHEEMEARVYQFSPKKRYMAQLLVLSSPDRLRELDPSLRVIVRSTGEGEPGSPEPQAPTPTPSPTLGTPKPEATATPDPFPGDYRGPDVTLSLAEPDEEGRYTGTVTLFGEKYPVQLTRNNDDTLTGSYKRELVPIPMRLHRDGESWTLNMNSRDFDITPLQIRENVQYD